jgi:hypothetical protein
MTVKDFLKTKSDSFLLEKEGTILFVPAENEQGIKFVKIIEMNWEMPLALIDLEKTLEDDITICTLYNPFIPMQYRKEDIY